MSEDMPWVNLTPEEIQELRTKKQELTEYGKQKIRELMNDGKLRFYDKGKETLAIDDSSWGKVQTPEMKLEVKEMTHEEMLEEAARRESIVAKVSEEDYQKVLDAAKEKKVLEIAKNFIEEHSEAMKQLAKIEHQELAAELALELRSWAQNEEMIDQYFTAHGEVCNQAADLLELFAKYQDSE